MRPSGRPLLTSRCLRSPVDAGSIPYSAVTQPRPEPISQRGTLSCTDAVQITRVSPIEISAEPVAVRTNPGSIDGRAQLDRGAAIAALVGLDAHAATPGAELDVHTSPSGICRKRVPSAWNGVDIAGAAESIRPLAGRGFSRSRAANARSTLRATPSPEVTSVTPRPSMRCSIGATSG